MSTITSTKNLIYFTIFFSPVYLIRFSILNIPLNLLDILILLTIIIWIYENKSNLKKEIKTLFKETFFILLPIFLILFGLFISTFLNNNFLKELGIIKSWFLLPIFFGLIVFNKSRNLIVTKKILNTLFLSSFFISIISIVYFFLNKLTYDHRLTAFYLSPNHLAMILVPGFLIGFWNIFKVNKKIDFLKLIYLFPILIALLFTQSYGAIISLLAGIFFILIFTQKKYIFVLFLFFALLLFSQYNSNKFEAVTNIQTNSSSSSRIAIWKSSIKIISDNWLWGIGPGNFQEKYLAYQKHFLPYPEWAVPQPHNIFLAFWLQSGLLGIIGFLYLLILFFIKKIKILLFSKDFNQKKITLITVAIIFSIIIHGLIDTPYWKNDLSLIFWTVIFLSFSSDALFNHLTNNDPK